MQLQEAIAEYLVAAHQAGRSENTIRQYRWNLDRMAKWLAEAGIEHLEDLSRRALREWGSSLREHWQPATIKQAVCAARSFLHWTYDEGWTPNDLADALKVPHVPKKVQRTLSIEEVAAVLEACDSTPIGIRNRALISLLVDSGLRASELCRLCRQDILDIDRGIMLVQVKGGDQHLGFFGESTAAYLRDWLEVHPELDGVDEVFVSVGGPKERIGKPLTPGGLRTTLRRIGEAAGIEGVSTHSFRRSFACISIEAGAPSRIVQLAGRWSNLAMVERYTQAMRDMQAGMIYREQFSAADMVEDNLKNRKTRPF